MVLHFVFFASSLLCIAEASHIAEGDAQQMWQQAWSTVLDQSGINANTVDGMPEELKSHLMQKAEKIWKSWLQERKGNGPASTTALYDQPSTTVNYAMQRLLAGVEPGYAAPVEQASFRQASALEVETTTTTTTVATTTQDAKVRLEQEQQQHKLVELRQSFMQKLTDGMGKIDEEEATATTTTVATTTTTTTVNAALSKLLEGVDRPAPVAKNVKQTTTTTTSTTTTTQTIGEAGKKTLAFISSGIGHFVMPHHQAPAERDNDDDDSEKNSDSEDSDEEGSTGVGSIAAEFDMDNAS